MRPCIDCGRPCKGTRCPAHQAPVTQADNARRHAKQRDHGRNTARWQRIRREVIDRDGGRCRECGAPARSVHLDPRLEGHHDTATVDDCALLCAKHHGALDGPRSRAK